MLRRDLETFFSDVRHGLRSVARTPGFTAVALLMIALPSAVSWQGRCRPTEVCGAISLFSTNRVIAG